MENEKSWNTFASTGKVSDYLNYASNRSGGDNCLRDRAGEERELRERTSNGHGAVGSYHW
jgi:hypothetical protein